MNYNSSMYPLLQSDDILFQISSSIHPPQQQTTHQHTLQAVVIPHQSTNDDEISNINDEKKKKIKKTIHRDVERQRRQEMATLYKELRSLLPLEYLKGKRSISDHVKEVVNYIKHQEKKIKVLRERRDKLKMPSINSDINVRVQLQPCPVGLVEVVIISGGLRDGTLLPLSAVLQLLGEEGLGVVSCFSTKVHETSILTIQSEVIGSSASIEPSRLQERLMSLVL